MVFQSLIQPRSSTLSFKKSAKKISYLIKIKYFHLIFFFVKYFCLYYCQKIFYLIRYSFFHDFSISEVFLINIKLKFTAERTRHKFAIMLSKLINLMINFKWKIIIFSH